MSCSSARRLLLPNLSIERFRGIKSLWLPKLGRATLLTGRNGVGKTTVLEAARIWAAHGTGKAIKEILLEREEIFEDRNGRLNKQDWTFLRNLFWKRNLNHTEQISIGPKGTKDSEVLKIHYTRNVKIANRDGFIDNKILSSHPNASGTVRKFGLNSYQTIWIPEPIEDSASDDYDLENTLQYIALGPGLPNTQTIYDFWAKIVLTSNEQRAVNALNIITKEKIERIAIIGEGHTLRIIANTKSSGAPFPLKSLGDGVMKLFAVATAISSIKGGFLFLDEAESGIHYSAQANFWKLVLQTAHDNDVQVIATTHSFDCIKGFAEASLENMQAEGVLVRIEDSEDELKAVTLDESDLQIVVEDNLEVR